MTCPSTLLASLCEHVSSSKLGVKRKLKEGEYELTIHTDSDRAIISFLQDERVPVHNHSTTQTQAVARGSGDQLSLTELLPLQNNAASVAAAVEAPANPPSSSAQELPINPSSPVEQLTVRKSVHLQGREYYETRLPIFLQEDHVYRVMKSCSSLAGNGCHFVLPLVDGSLVYPSVPHILCSVSVSLNHGMCSLKKEYFQTIIVAGMKMSYIPYALPSNNETSLHFFKDDGSTIQIDLKLASVVPALPHQPSPIKEAATVESRAPAFQTPPKTRSAPPPQQPRAPIPQNTVSVKCPVVRTPSIMFPAPIQNTPNVPLFPARIGGVPPVPASRPAPGSATTWCGVPQMSQSMMNYVLQAAGISSEVQAKYLERWGGLNEHAKCLEWKTLQAFRTQGDVIAMQNYMMCTLSF